MPTRIRTRLLLNANQQEEMQCGDEEDGDNLALIQGQMLPPELPALA
jgi:hypothetical protein